VAFAGAEFERCQQIGNYDPTFAGGAWRGKATIPARVFARPGQFQGAVFDTVESETTRERRPH
jgi:hypothetical protein